MTPRLLVLSWVFPSAVQPGAGLFIRERMFRVGRLRPIVVVAPQPWFPGQSLVRRFRPNFRPMAPARETMDGVEIHRPRFFCIPGVLKWTDGFFMALGTLPLARRLVRERHVNLLDVHFGYPEGYAGRLLARWLGLPMVVTFRGKEHRQAASRLRPLLQSAVREARQVIAVSNPLRKLAIELGAAPERTHVVGNGIDLATFRPLPAAEARRALGLPERAHVLVTVGTLIEHKGFNRVFEVMRALLAQFPDLHYLVVGGPGPAGDDSAWLRQLARDLDLADRVHFTGPLRPDQLRVPLSAADVFVLATRYEGWSNVLLEAMACGLPVVTTEVGGNPQVVCRPELGRLVPFGDAEALRAALDEALRHPWDRERIRAYASENAWEARIPALLDVYDRALAVHARERVARTSPRSEASGAG